MLLGDARVLSTDLAKVSVALAEAAYRKSGINDLEKLGYTVDQTTYDQSYSKVYDMDLWDNDYVAYSVWRKPCGDYTLYIVPVKGTSRNLEWFSDFNLGDTSENNGYHEGFYKAARRALTGIYNCFSQNGSSDGTRVVLFTGHSRGAAVANLLAGWMTDNPTYVSQNHLFCYTFACPSVGHANVVSDYPNIRNFNNAGDLIPLLPLETGVTAGWNFSRYGHGHTISEGLTTGHENFIRLFTNYWGDAYRGQSSEANYQNILKAAIPSESDYEEKHWILDIAAYYFFGGKDHTTLDEFLRYMVTRHGIDIAKFIGKLTPVGNMVDFMQDILDGQREFEERIEMIQALLDALADPGDKSEDEILEQYQAAVDLVKRTLVISTVPTVSQIRTARDLLQGILDESIRKFEGSWGLFGLFYDSAFHPISAVNDGHEPHTYLFWINSKYAGCNSWSGMNISAVPDECALSNCTSIGARAFQNCTALTSVTLPTGLRYIGDSAFSGCSGIASALTFSGEMRSIGENAFIGCSGITRAVASSDGMRSVGNSAFENCTGLEELVIPDTVTALGVSSIGGCSGLKALTMPAELVMASVFIASGANSTDSVETLHLTPGATGVMYDLTGADYSNGVAYRSRENLKTVILEEGVTHVGDYAFYGCSAITSVRLPSTLKSVGVSAFHGASQWAEPLALPEGLTTLGTDSFSGCSALTGLTLPSTLTGIPNYCFQGCSGLTAPVRLPDTLDSIGSNAFQGVSQTLEVYPYSVGLRYARSAGASHVLLDYAELSLPAARGEIDDEAFVGISAELIALPEGCGRIGNRAFAESAARVLILPDNVDIAADAFAGCPVRVVVCGADTPTQAWAQAMGLRTWTSD